MQLSAVKFGDAARVKIRQLLVAAANVGIGGKLGHRTAMLLAFPV